MKTRIEKFMGLYTFDVEAYEFYRRAGLHHPLAAEKAEQASWLKVLVSTTRTEAIELGFNSKRLFYLNACIVFTTKNWRGWKSTNLDYLYKRMQAFRKDAHAYQSLLSGKFKNKNASVKLSQEQREILIRCYKKTVPRTLKGAYKRYLNIAQSKIQSGEWIEKDKKGRFRALISLSSAKQFLKRNV